MTRILSARTMAWILVGIVLFALLPIVSVLAASGIASLADCQLNEASTHPCVILGIDGGGLLTLMFVAGWMALATVPIGAVALAIWIAAAIVLVILSRNRSA